MSLRPLLGTLLISVLVQYPQTLKTPQDAAALLARLEAPDFATRRDALLDCRGRREPEIRAAVLRHAQTDPHPNIRGFAWAALGELRDPNLVPKLMTAIGNDTNIFPRESACEALGKTKDPRAFDALATALAGDAAVGAVRGLAELGDARAFPLLAAVFEREIAKPSRFIPRVTEVVPGALVRLDRDAATAVLLRVFPRAESGALMLIMQTLRELRTQQVRSAMVEQLGSPDSLHRRAAVNVLGSVGDASCVRPLLDLFANDAALRADCAEALGSQGDRRAAAPLIAALGARPDAKERRSLYGALGALHAPEAFAPLVKALGREDDAVAAVVLARALGTLGDRRAVAALLAKLDDVRTSRQPREISSIWGFPWNVRVSDAATWAAAKLAFGAEPCKVEQLSKFPSPVGPESIAAARRRLTEWWEKLSDHAPFEWQE